MAGTVRRDVVLVGSSAGGVEALRALVADLPADLPAAVLVVQHQSAGGGDALAAILDRAGPLPVRAARSGEALREGTVLLAPPGRHLLVDAGGRAVLSAGPRENGHRPSVDALFRSAAVALGARAVAVVLTGMLDDGAAGAAAVARGGGAVLVQDPEDAAFSGMPAAAVAAVPAAGRAALGALPAALADLVAAPGSSPAPGERRRVPPPALVREAAVAAFDLGPGHGDDHAGEPSGYTCPDCDGVLWRLEEHGLLRFRCRVGHAWSARTLLDQQSMTLEGALWIALRGLEEKAALVRELARRTHEGGRHWSSTGFSLRAEEAEEAAVLLRKLLTDASLGEDDR